MPRAYPQEQEGPSFVEKATVSYTGSAGVSAITLNRGNLWDIKSVTVMFGAATAAAYFQVLRASSTPSGNQLDATHADSVDVLLGEQYLQDGIKLDLDHRNMADTNLYVNLSLGGSSGTVYIKVEYDYKAQ